jgi:hypothetical protein
MIYVPGLEWPGQVRVQCWSAVNDVQPSAFVKNGGEFLYHLWDFNHLKKDIIQ